MTRANLRSKKSFTLMDTLKGSHKDEREDRRADLEKLVSAGPPTPFFNFKFDSISELKLNSIRHIFTDIRSRIKIINPIFFYDRPLSIASYKLYKRLFKKALKDFDTVCRIFALFYRILYESIFSSAHESPLSNIIYSGQNDLLLYKLKKLTSIINSNCLRIFGSKDISIFNAITKLSPIDPCETLNIALALRNDIPQLFENNLIQISFDPYETKGAMCKFMGSDWGFFIFSPYYSNYISAITLIHELGHLMHYKAYGVDETTVFEAIHEEFFAFYFELYWLYNNLWNVEPELMEKILWQRIWFVVVRQLQIFLFEVSNIISSKNITITENILKQNWLKTSQEILSYFTPKWEWHDDSWFILTQIIFLPFRSYHYVIGSLLALYYLLKNIPVTKDLFKVASAQGLLENAGLSSFEELIDDLIILMGKRLAD